jgi:hypothetical protein
MTARIQANSPIRTELIAVLHETASGLAKWLHGQLLRHGGKNWWTHHVCEFVSERDQARVADGEWKELTDMDLGALLTVLQTNFRFLVSRRGCDKDFRETIRATREARNRCEGHWPVNGLTAEELLIHLSSIRKFVGVIGGSKSDVANVDLLISKIQQWPLSGAGVIPTEDTPDRIPAVAHLVQSSKQLADFFEGEALTPSQGEAIAALQLFLDDSEQQCFILRGYAGTGKTFLIGGLMRYLKADFRKPCMMAPTGRAAHVLRERHQVDASTIHRSIYSLNALKEYRELDESGEVTFKFYFDLKNNDIEHDTVFIVDEASMISDVYSEAEFMHFGSGRLLHDLMRYINFDANDYRKKLILVGDDAQLPPVGMNSSPALDPEYLIQKCRVRSHECQLTDVVRQNENSPILENATRMREMLRTGKFASFNFSADGGQIRELQPHEFVEAFVNERACVPDRDSVIIAHTNASVKTYNEAVRSRIFPNLESITSGDQIIVVRNNYNYERPLLNGQMGRVVAVTEASEVRGIPLNLGLDESGKRQNEIVPLAFRTTTLRFNDDRGEPFEITCKILENCLTNNQANIPSEYSKALYVDFKKRHKDLKPGQPEFKEALKADGYFNAVMIKFGYAITCHKAQGGEWHTVFVDFAGQNKLNVEGIRWSYTALTRAESRVVATNALHHHVLKPKKEMLWPHKVAELAQVMEDHISGGAIQAQATPHNMPKESPIEMIRRCVAGCLPEGWAIASARSLPYQERLTLAVGKTTVTASVFYKSDYRVSKVQVQSSQGQNEIENQAAQFLAPLKGRSMSLENGVAARIRPAHEPFCETLKESMVATGLQLVSLESKTDFHLVARLRSGNREATIDYYFDGKGTFSRFVLQSDCPADLVEQIQSIHD